MSTDWTARKDDKAMRLRLIAAHADKALAPQRELRYWTYDQLRALLTAMSDIRDIATRR